MPIGAAVGTAAVGIGGSVLGANATKDAAKDAASTARATSASNNALTREMYGFNAQRLDPYAIGGIRAGNALQGLLLGPQATTAPGGTGGGGALGGNPGGGFTTPGVSSPEEAAWATGAVNAMWRNITRPDVRSEAMAISDPVQRLQYLLDRSPPNSDQIPLYNQYAQAHPRPTATAQPTTPPPATGTPGTPGAPVNSALSAWDQFRNSTNYQWRFGEGQKALLTSGLPGGTFDSGQTRKAAIEYGQNFAANELGSYMDRLAQQQQLGLAGASALAGVGQNMVGNVTANNNAAAGAAANAALVGGTATANMWGGIANSVGTAVGALGKGGSIYGH